MLRRVLLIALVLLLFPMMPALTPGAHAAASLPSYQLQYLGPGRAGGDQQQWYRGRYIAER